MTETTQDVSPAEGANALEEPVAPPTTTDEATDKTPADDAGTKETQPRDENGRFQSRIDRVTWEKHEERRLREAIELERDYWRTQAESAKKPAAPSQLKEPTLEDFGHDEAKYRAAVREYDKAVIKRDLQAEFETDRQERTQRTKQVTFRQREAEFISKTPDYTEVAYRAPISDEVAALVMESDVGPEVAYYLGKNPIIARQISQLSDRGIAREIGRIEERLSLQKAAPATPQASKAPPPPPKVAASGDSNPTVKPTDPESDKMANDDWMKARIKQLQRRKG